MLRFNGTWKIDIANASKWDTATKTYIPDAVGEEIITIRVDNAVRTYEVPYGDGPVITGSGRPRTAARKTYCSAG